MKYNDEMLKEMQDLFAEGVSYENLINQNKNNRKIPITEIAISKIPYVNYPDLTIDDCNKLYELEKLLLGLSKDENNHNEVAITYRLYKEPNETEDDRIAIVYGDEHEVNLGADTKTFHLLQSDRLAVINMHNHPNCSNFSLYDISFFLRNDSVKLLILLSNKGELCYISKNDSYSRINNVALYIDACRQVIPNAISGSVIDFSKMTENDMVIAANIWIKKARNLGIDYEHVQNNERRIDYERANHTKKFASKKSNKIRDDFER